MVFAVYRTDTNSFSGAVNYKPLWSSARNVNPVSNEGLKRTSFSAVVGVRIVMQRSSRSIDSVRFEVVLSTGKIVTGVSKDRYPMPVL